MKVTITPLRIASKLQLCPAAGRLTFAMVALALGTMHAFAGSVLVYRNAGWRITDWKYHVRTNPPTGGDAWQQPNFDDASWMVAKGPFGYGIPSRYGLDLKEMKGAHSTLYLRTTFFVSDRSKLNRLLLDVNYTGGFVAWINGVRVAERNAPARGSHDAIATARRKTTAGDYESVALKNPAAFLRNGENVLALQAFTVDRDGSEFYIDAGLVNTRSVAHNKPVFALSAGWGQNRDKQFLLPFNAVDETQLTFFSSGVEMPQWFYVDLGRDHTIDKVRFHWWGDRQPREFQVQVSRDARNWTNVHAATAAPRTVRTDVRFSPTAARYVRLRATRMPDEKYGIFFGGCEVFEPDTEFESSEFHSLAIGRDVTASSEAKPGSFHGAKEMAVNGHGLSWWSSKPEDPQWLAVDLGSRRPVNRVRLYLKENNKAFRIQTSDDAVTWHDVRTENRTTLVSGGDVKSIVDLRFPAEITTRHVRFFGTGRDNPAHGYSIVEFAVYRDEL